MIEALRTRFGIRKQPKERSFYRKEQPLQRIASEALSFVYTPEIKLDGKENIQEAESLLSQGKKLIVMSNHLTHGDAEVIRQALRRNGFKDLSKKSLFLIGEKVRKNPAARWFGRSHNGIDVWSQSLPTKNEEEEKKKARMNFKAVRDSRKALQRGHYVVVFPEGGRSYEGTLKEAEPEIAHFLKLVIGDYENAFILPIGIHGIEKIFPPQKVPLPPPPWRPIPVYVAVGAPVNASLLVERYKDYPEDEKNNRIMEDFMRYFIAPRLPKEYRGRYS